MTPDLFWDIVVVIILTSPVWFMGIMFYAYWPRDLWPFKSKKDEVEPTDDEKRRIAEYEKEVQLEYQEKEKLIEEIKGLSDEDLDSYQRFFEYIQSGLEVGYGDLIQFASERLRANRQLVLLSNLVCRLGHLA